MSVFATGPRAVGFTIVLGGRVVTMQMTTLVESEYRNVFLELFPRYAGSSAPRGYRRQQTIYAARQ